MRILSWLPARDNGRYRPKPAAPPLPDMLEDPPHARTARRRIAGDDELFGRVRAAFAVDPQALLDLEHAFGGAELPQRPAAHPQQRAQFVGGQARRNIAPKVKDIGQTSAEAKRG